ncbi:MAG: pyridoxine 5'-phosphate synthase [Candidatus Gastranaerophilales bacterium]|nr:pyridoxine 5'-phosphate synthase [Candidatus Gastranaerophilales bacterium]
MVKLGVNIDHIATLRNARGQQEPEPVLAAGICELAGADSITVHLREDRRHIKDANVRALKHTLRTRMNLEMAATKEMQEIALEILSHSCCIVPENRREITTEGGLDVENNLEYLTDYIAVLKNKGIIVSLFINPDEKQVEAAAKAGAQYIELHTGQFSLDYNTPNEHLALENLKQAFIIAKELGLSVNAGHGINYHNVAKLLEIKGFEELNIGHGIISKAVFVGLDNAVKEMKQLIDLNS